ncbi:outer membrane protein [Phreatobacter oligotrophus]|jgi:outer membrane immunogenic protein|uniref:outer membrane protein n=1 Tax=Phreatobacter oligotrophus TaxID=1122261 RepID=UPI002355A2B4|nr:outer membrane protein [Phreatobacter oligotrophus]MBX9990591.1 porin family protein [Phreatobacter oligotrophus]
MKTFLLATTALVAFTAGAQAADLGVPRSPVAAAVVAPAFSWTGFYVGAHAGYGFGNSRFVALGVFPTSVNGPLLGGQVGFNYQINQIVLGVEADLAFAAITGRPGNFPAISHRTNMLGSLRARGGFAVDRALLYVTGGLGFQGAATAQTPGPAEKYTRMGWTLGAGVEYALTQNWTAKLEYSYYNFGTRTLGPIYGGTVRSDIHTVKIGVNYLFSTGPSAVVARY